jgi:hypothetical protein
MRHPLLRILPFAMTVASVGLTGMAALGPEPGRPVAAVFPPWWTGERAFSAASLTGGSIVRFGGLASILVLTSATPDFNQRLHDAGAWVLLDAQAFGGCATTVVDAAGPVAEDRP